MKLVAIVLTIIALGVALWVGIQLKGTTPTASTAQIETTVKDLNAKIELARNLESEEDKKLREVIDTHSAPKGTNPVAFEQLKEDLKTNASETSSMPALKEASDESNALRTQIEDLKKQNAPARSSIDWPTYIPKVLLSIILLGVSLFIILKGNYAENIEKWALSMISIVVGMWVGTISS